MEVRVALADKDHLVAQAIARLIEAEQDILLTGTYTEGTALLRGLRARRTDVLVVDPSGLAVTGTRLIRMIRSAHPDLRIIVLTADQRERQLVTAIRAGVRGYLSKSVTPVELLHAIRAVGRGLGAFGPEQAAGLIDVVSQQPDGDAGLTRRQHDLLSRIVQGKTNREIADDLYLTEKTVKNYMKGLFSRLGVRSRTEAVVRAFQYDLVSERDWIPVEDESPLLQSLPG